MPSVPPRRNEAVPERGTLLQTVLRHRKTKLSARPARPRSQGEDRRIRTAAARKAEGEAHLRRSREPVPHRISRRPSARRASPARTCSRSSNGVWTTFLSGSDLRPRTAQARQLVRHGHVLVNGKKVNIPSFQVAIGHEISVKEKMKKNVQVVSALELAGGRGTPHWLELNARTCTGKNPESAQAGRHQSADSGTNDRGTCIRNNTRRI